MRNSRILVSSAIAMWLLATPWFFIKGWNNISLLSLNHNSIRSFYQNSRFLDEEITSGLQFALDTTPIRGSIDWTLGRLAMANNDAHSAIPYFERAAFYAPSDHPIHQDLLLALSADELHERVISLYESGRFPLLNPTISDAIALAYLKIGDNLDLPERSEYLLRARLVRPIDLFINYTLRKLSPNSIGEKDLSDLSLKFFPLSALFPDDKRLRPYAVSAIVGLIEDQIWSKDSALNYTSYLIWEHSEETGVEDLLNALRSSFPFEPEWPFFLAELYFRRGEYSKAIDFYQISLELSIEDIFPQALLYLGLAIEKGCDSQSYDCIAHATEWYARYNRQNPKDVMGLQKLFDKCAQLVTVKDAPDVCRTLPGILLQGDFPAFNPENNLDDTLWEILVISKVLGIPPEHIVLGENLVENSGFEDWQQSQSLPWCWSAMFDREPFGNGLFVGGPEVHFAPEGGANARVQGLWIEQNPEKEPPRAGYWYCNQNLREKSIDLHPNRRYLLSFFYRTVYTANTASIWMSSINLSQNRLWFDGDIRLPDTNGEWRQFAVVDLTAKGLEHLVRPLFRLFGPGQLEVDRFQIREVFIEVDDSLDVQLPAFSIP